MGGYEKGNKKKKTFVYKRGGDWTLRVSMEQLATKTVEGMSAANSTTTHKDCTTRGGIQIPRGLWWPRIQLPITPSTDRFQYYNLSAFKQHGEQAEHSWKNFWPKSDFGSEGGNIDKNFEAAQSEDGSNSNFHDKRNSDMVSDRENNKNDKNLPLQAEDKEEMDFDDEI